MVQKTKERDTAVKLRRKGLSYREILAEIPVAKSTLSLWLRHVGLAKIQKQALSEKRRVAALLGATRRREQRIISTRTTELLAQKEAARFSNKPLWLAGTMLYWAEGAKQKETNISQGVKFSNSDSDMIKLFLKWLIEICKLGQREIKCELYIHQNSNIEKAINYWNKQLMPLRVEATYLKRNKTAISRKNIDNGYHGLITIQVRRSTNLNRKIRAWIKLFLKKENIGEWCNW
ncbi:MAG: hypothetical protein HY454_04120 [Parcubacteria group bacterium]|nr:hypothetical protein [Parcubacteria group bacterium]